MTVERNELNTAIDCNIDDWAAGRLLATNYFGNQYADSFARRGADVVDYSWNMPQSINGIRERACRIGLGLAATILATAQT